MADFCPFYRYESGIFSYRDECKKTGKKNLDSELYNNYCKGNYSSCPYFKPQSSSSGGCYLTSACVEAMGLPDDCLELTTLRNFRDNWLAVQEGGAAEIAEYYRIAPEIVRRIHASEDCLQILKDLFTNLVRPCVALIEKERNEDAHALYRSITEELKDKYL